MFAKFSQRATRRLSRRRFLRQALRGGVALAGSAALSPLAGCASRLAVIPPADPARRVFCDLHVHSDMNSWLRETPVGLGNPRLLELATAELNQTSARLEEMYGAGMDLAVVGHFNLFDEWLSMPSDPSPEAPGHTEYMLDLMEAVLEENAQFARLVRTPAELDALLEHRPGDPQYRVAVGHALEGGHAFGGDLHQIERFARRGVIYTTLTHFFQKGLSSAPNALPFFPDANAARPHQGMSGLGLEALSAMEDVGMIVDLTHMTDHALEDALTHARRPLLASHMSARSLADHSYAFHDEHIQEIARGGGLLGVILYPYILSNYGDEYSAHAGGSLTDTVRTVRYITKICGTHRVVGIGSDFSGYIVGPQEMRSVGEIELLRQRLQTEFEKDHSSAQATDIVEDVMARNALRFVRENWRPPA